MPPPQPTPSHETLRQPHSSQPDAQWLDDDTDELPPRPRRRLAGPLPLALLATLLIACGFIGGVLVEKGQVSTGASSGSAAGLASRFAALRSGAAGSPTGVQSASASGAGAFTRPTTGTVAYLAGKTLYVTDTEGNTIKVATSSATSVSKTATASVRGIHPGETVSVVGATTANGSIRAQSISVGSSGGGLSGLFGSGARSTTGGAQSLFGSGG
ncbi:MAG: hypothetical protein ACYDHN_09170 [Solirubrobacteraceae bacterium]